MKQAGIAILVADHPSVAPFLSTTCRLDYPRFVFLKSDSIVFDTYDAILRHPCFCDTLARHLRQKSVSNPPDEPRVW